MVLTSVADDSYGRAAMSWSIELGEVDALPRAEGDLAVTHRERHRVPDEHRLHVRGTVSFGVLVPRIAGNGAFERGEEIALHVGVGVLVDEHPRGRVRDRHRDDPVGDLRTGDRGLDPRGDVDRLLALVGRHRDPLVTDAHEVPAPAPAIARCPAMRPMSAGVALPPLTKRTLARPATSTLPARTAASGAAPDGSTSSERASRYSNVARSRAASLTVTSSST